MPKLVLFCISKLDPNCHAQIHDKTREVISLMKRLKRLLLARSRPVRGRGSFNSALLEQRREEVFAVLHQQMSGLR